MSKPPLPFPRGARTLGKTAFLIAAVVTLSVVVLTFAWVVIRNAQPHETLHVVAYAVSGSAPQATVIYTRPDGQQDATVDLPWSISFDAASGVTLSLVAHSSDGSSITCVITEDGKTVSSQSGPECSPLAGS